jgi:hypothetical protein
MTLVEIIRQRLRADRPMPFAVVFSDGLSVRHLDRGEISISPDGSRGCVNLPDGTTRDFFTSEIVEVVPEDAETTQGRAL